MADQKDTKPTDGKQGESRPNGRGPGGRGNGPKPPNFMSRNALGWILLLGLAVALLLLFQSATNQAAEVPFNTFLNYARDGKFKDNKVLVEETRLSAELNDNVQGEPVGSSKTLSRNLQVTINPNLQPYFLHRLDGLEQPPDYSIENSNSLLIHLLISWGPIILIAVLIYFFVFRSLRNAGAGPGMLGNFGRSRHKVMTKEHSTVTLDDVAGIDEAKDEVGEIIEFLKNPKRFQRLGGRVPRGVLLIGSPGCGKTLLAKAVAGEAEVPFFSISGSDFVEMFVGVGASRVRDLFKQAKDSSPCIIFLDEIDAVGRRRGSGFNSGGHDEREQTLNAILVEMDGFESNDQVIVVAATNRADVLDPALTRPGRFDRQIHVPLPDIRGRMEILKVHSRRIKLSPHVDMEKLARGTPMFSGADLAAIINEAAIAATLQNKDFVEMDDLEEARDKVRWGRARKSHRIEEDEKKVIAYHEAGHAAIMYYDKDSEPLHKVTIIPRGQGLGVTFMLPEKDRHIYQRKQLLAQLRVTFGGRIAEELFIGDISSGAAMDIRQATSIARAMVTEYGMSEKLGFQLYGIDSSRNPWEQPDRMYSDDTASLIDEEVKAIIDQTYREAKEIIESHRKEMDDLAAALLKHETLSADEVDKVMTGQELAKATVSDLLAAEREKQSDDEAEPESSAPQKDDGGDAPGVMPTPA